MTPTRIAALAALLAGVSVAVAQLPVAPPPRAVRTDGTRDPVPEPAAKETPLDIVNRIIDNSKKVGDKLARTDVGTDTQKTQQTILKDIDALLDDDPPPPKQDQNQDMNDPKDNKQSNPDPKDNKQDMPPTGGMGDPPPMSKDMPMAGTGGNDPPPMGKMEPPPHGGMSDPLPERRPRQKGDQKQDARPMDEKKDMNPDGGMQQPKKQDGGGGTQNDPKAGNPDAKKGPPEPPRFFDPNQAPGGELGPSLPDRLRQSAIMQQRDQFPSRYAKLLELYYAPRPAP